MLKNKGTALIVADMLNDFVNKGAPLEVSKARDIVHNIKREITKARKAHIPIIYCCDMHKENDPEFRLWPRHAVKGTAGAQIIEQLKPSKNDYIIGKTSYSSFYKTSLNELLKSLGITHLIITGAVTNICILYTAVDAYMRGYKVRIPEDCIAALTEREHRFAIQQMKGVLKADIV